MAISVENRKIFPSYFRVFCADAEAWRGSPWKWLLSVNLLKTEA